MAERFREHVWEPLREYDACICSVCGTHATMTEIGVGTDVCPGKENIDNEFSQLLAGEIDPPPDNALDS